MIQIGQRLKGKKKKKKSKLVLSVRLLMSHLKHQHLLGNLSDFVSPQSVDYILCYYLI